MEVSKFRIVAAVISAVLMVLFAWLFLGGSQDEVHSIDGGHGGRVAGQPGGVGVDPVVAPRGEGERKTIDRVLNFSGTVLDDMGRPLKDVVLLAALEGPGGKKKKKIVANAEGRYRFSCDFIPKRFGFLPQNGRGLVFADKEVILGECFLDQGGSYKLPDLKLSCRYLLCVECSVSREVMGFLNRWGIERLVWSLQYSAADKGYFSPVWSSRGKLGLLMTEKALLERCAPCRLSLSASRRGYVQFPGDGCVTLGRWRVEPREGRYDPVKATLDGSGLVYGEVVSEKGRALPGVRVKGTFFGQGGKWYCASVTTGKGCFCMYGGQFQEGALQAGYGDLHSRSQPILFGGEGHTITLDVSRNVRFRVVDANGDPVVRYRLRWRPQTYLKQQVGFPPRPDGFALLSKTIVRKGDVRFVETGSGLMVAVAHQDFSAKSGPWRVTFAGNEATCRLVIAEEVPREYDTLKLKSGLEYNGVAIRKRLGYFFGRSSGTAKGKGSGSGEWVVVGVLPNVYTFSLIASRNANLPTLTGQVSLADGETVYIDNNFIGGREKRGLPKGLKK